MYIYKYMSNLQTYIYSVHLQPPFAVQRPLQANPPPQTLRTIYTEGKFRRTGRRSHSLTHNTFGITSRHPPLCNNQGWLYHRTGPGPVTCAASPEQTPWTASPASSSPSSSYASGPPNPPWTERGSRGRTVITHGFTMSKKKRENVQREKNQTRPLPVNLNRFNFR